MKKANRNATKGKGKLWKKGQSSSYNPECNKYRQAAKKRGVFGNPGGGMLTESVLERHNKLTAERTFDSKDDGMSVGGETAMTAFTNCSLPTFTRWLKNWNAGSFLHKEMVAVLAAVTEILQSNGGKETETEYFAALMTTLNVVDADEGVTAVICLLSMLVKRVNQSVLKLQSKAACETFTKLLIKYMNSDHCALLKNLLTIVFTFLKLRTQWGDTSDELTVILEFTTHHKPKVRREAHRIIRNLLNDHIPESSTFHPWSTLVSDFCVQRLENIGGKPETSRDVFYILALLQDVIIVFPKASIKKCCETVFKVMTLSNAVVTLCGLKSFQGLFDLNRQHNNLPVDLNARIITALYDYQPNVKDSACLICWFQLMEAALINLFSLDEKLCLSHLPKFYSVAVKCWLNDAENVMYTVASTLKSVVEICVNPSSEVFQQLLFEDPVNNAVHKMFHHVEEALSYQYHNAWGHVLSVIAGFFETVGKHSYTVMRKCLQSLADLHDSYNFPHVPEVERAIGMAIQHMGPRIVLEVIPLNIESDKPDFRRSWLLPLLRDYIKRTELEFFVKFFLPLASKVKSRALVVKQEGKMVENKLYEVLCSQIWSLLPGFCTEPTDLKTCFKEVARTLGLILRDDRDLRPTILSALRLLINKNLENEENLEEVAKFAKNYVPILFNLYTTEPKDKEEIKVRLAVYDILKLYLTITDKELCATFFAKAQEKLTSESGEFMQHALMDLCRAMLPGLNEDQIKELYEYAKPLLTHQNNTIQKKAYSVIKDICSLESCRTFVIANLEDVRMLLAGNKLGLTPATRALRLNCLQSVVSQLTENEKPIIIEIVPEAVICTKENSVKARTASYDLLVEIGHTIKRFTPDNPKEALRVYMKMLLAGLSGSPHLMSATILAIGRVMYEFKDEMDSAIIHLLIENMCLLMSSRSREVIVASLSFMKILFASVDTSTLAQHVEFLVKGITNISEDNQRHFRFKAKEIFTRLIRKFGYEMISKMVPATYQKQLINIRKAESRKHRKRERKNDDVESIMFTSHKRTNDFEDVLADSEDDMDFEDEVKQKTTKTRRRMFNAPCIEENADDDIMDLLDPAVNKRLTMRPDKEVPSKTQNDSFPVSEDGKLIIQFDNEPPTKEKKEKNLKSAVLNELGASVKKNKRKLEDSDSEDGCNKMKDNSSTGVATGIHRSLGPKAKRMCPGKQFKAKKAGGDVKKGKLDPYAYIPLNRQALNKRKQVKLKGQYKNIVKAAQKGAAVGVKRKARDSKRRKM